MSSDYRGERAKNMREIKEILILSPEREGFNKVTWTWCPKTVTLISEEIDKVWMSGMKRVFDVNATAEEVYGRLIRKKDGGRAK